MSKSTALTFLEYATGEGTNFTKLVDITSYPALFSPPEKLDVSDLSHRQKLYEQGMIDVPDMEFGYIYTKDAYDRVKALEVEGTEYTYKLKFGKDGEYGAWTWKGTHFTHPDGGQVGGARQAKVIIYPGSEVTPVAGA